MQTKTFTTPLGDTVEVRRFYEHGAAGGQLVREEIILSAEYNAEVIPLRVRCADRQRVWP